ncbi:class I SAM-dependent methyltransferase [Amycolatopsis sp., V23-08]|uniref:Class I SAM-dependent methyltransferase n=1 Tax=Amycolatopsis heterodermiae TaxID=3110235 RepID=A0ABU5QZ73_9PSEU|nr:class I SAM-dependent methyltransferase [Amycolatopsis sp., V23-08]MEA5359216.1 class I SAM-dependent methyltransferase [Amycolatopsis sp., V23-08]
MSDPTADIRARQAASFGARAGAYAEHRPDYAREAIEWGLAGAEGTPRRVLDLAAGTGKVTVTLAELGLDVTAVEPDPEMLAELSRLLPSVTALEGRAEQIPLPDASVDAVFVGQAFHWFDAGLAMTEMARVLRPGGVFVPMWNYEDESVPWVAEFTETAGIGGRRPNTDTEQQPATHAAFTAFESSRFRHAHRRTAESLVETFQTYSRVIVSDEAETAPLVAQVRRFLETNPATASGEFDLPLITWVFRSRRR